MEKNIYVILVVLALSCHLVEGHYTFPLPNIILASDRSINIDNIRRRRESSTPRPVKQIEKKKNINRRGSIQIDESNAYSSVGPWGVSISTGTYKQNEGRLLFIIHEYMNLTQGLTHHI